MEEINESKMRYLEMIQEVITRMGSNSFALKGWAVTLIAGIFALASKDADKMFFLITYVPVVFFWALDSYYLQLELKYRVLYERVRKDLRGIDFIMDVSDIDFSVEEKNKLCYFSCFISTTELWFYFPCAVLVAIVIILTTVIGG